jgi:hypothetical protein
MKRKIIKELYDPASGDCRQAAREAPPYKRDSGTVARLLRVDRKMKAEKDARILRAKHAAKVRWHRAG